MGKDTQKTDGILAFPFKELGMKPETFKKDPANSVHALVSQSLHYGIDRLIGDLLTILESVGLPEKQEKAVKSQITKAYYERYGKTSEGLIHICFALMRTDDPNTGNSLGEFAPRMNTDRIGGMPLDRVE